MEDSLTSAAAMNFYSGCRAELHKGKERQICQTWVFKLEGTCHDLFPISGCKVQREKEHKATRKCRWETDTLGWCVRFVIYRWTSFEMPCILWECVYGRSVTKGEERGLYFNFLNRTAKDVKCAQEEGPEKSCTKRRMEIVFITGKTGSH